ncbi:exocyst complex component Sec5-domain-containing protein [Nemania abortiva]|nr:exocyst complex component Sec5-domain-containing protein [Nemania abortiva]
MADFDRNVLDFYGISTLMPTTWPSEKNDKTDDSDSEREQQRQQQQKKINRRKSRYEALERAVSNRSSVVAGSETSAGGVSNLVQRDEPDPLGFSDNVVRTLKDLGVPIQDDTRLRNRFLLSSTSFSPALFLSQMHANADTQSLLRGLDVLSRSIDQKSASLKVLVESNFERFVRAKATIDNVYKEMKYRGAEPPTTPTTRARAHSRHASRSSFRGSSGGATTLGANPLLSPAPGDSRKKNALVKESDYGVSGIKAPLLDVSAKAEDVWGPALGGREKEENIRTVSICLDRYKEYIETSSNIADSIRRKDYDALIEEYSRAKRFVDETRKLVDDLGPTPPSETQTYQVLIAARMWYDVDEQIRLFKRELWKRMEFLYNMPKTDTRGPAQDQHMELIGLLLELGVEDNPIEHWLWGRYGYLKGRVSLVGGRTKMEIEVLRRRLANADKPSPQVLASHLRSLSRHSVGTKPNGLDTSDVIELWEKIVSFLSSLLSPQGVLGEVLEFWQTVESFIDGKAQKSLPMGYNDESRENRRLSTNGTLDLRKATTELVDEIRTHILEFFEGGPPEDISSLSSPLPPGSATDSQFRIDAKPPPSPKRGEYWEALAFWPPSSNSITGVHYLSKMLGIIGTGAADIVSVVPTKRDDLKTLVEVARKICVKSLCDAWDKDAENIELVEDWQRSKEMGDITCMPATLATFEGALISGLQEIVYVPGAIAKPGSRDIIVAPPDGLLTTIKTHYQTTLEKVVDGMVRNAEQPVTRSKDQWITDMDTPIGSISDRASSLITRKRTVDASDKNVRMLLTLNNLQALHSKFIPTLNSQFETAFSTTLPIVIEEIEGEDGKTVERKENKIQKTIREKYDALLKAYILPSVGPLSMIISEGFQRPDWAPASATAATTPKPYIYEVLLSLVVVHTQVSTTAPSLTENVIIRLYEIITSQILQVFGSRPKYDIGALMQATLDYEFLAWVLKHYTSDTIGELHDAIYAILDSKTNDKARKELEKRLTGMGDQLASLHAQARTEFACFGKDRRHRAPGRTATGWVPKPDAPVRQGPDQDQEPRTMLMIWEQYLQKRQLSTLPAEEDIRQYGPLSSIEE